MTVEETETMRRLVCVVNDFLPNIKNCCLQDYSNLNIALRQARDLLGDAMPDDDQRVYYKSKVAADM